MTTEVTLIEPLSVSKYDTRASPLPYVHVYEECPAVRRAERRDGEVLRSRAPVDAFLNPPAAEPCGWCLRKWKSVTSDVPAVDNPPPDLGYTGDAMDYWVAAGVVAYRRHGSVVTFGINSTVVPLGPDDAEAIARHLFAAAVAAREAAGG